MSKKRTMTCKLCGAEGYNSRKCPTKTHPWTALTIEEVGSITSLLGISNTQLSQQQIDHAITQRTTDAEPLAVYYHANLDKLPPIDTSSPEGQIAQALNGSEINEPQPVQFVATSDDMDTIKSDFDQELWYLCHNNVDREIQVSPDGLVGNSYFEHWTNSETGLLSILARVSVNTQDYELITEWNCVPTGQEIAKHMFSQITGSVTDYVEPVQIVFEDSSEKDCTEPFKPIFIDNRPKSVQVENRPNLGLTLIGYEPTDMGYKVLYFGDQGYQQGEKELGFKFAAKLDFPDVERVIENMSGNMRLVKIPVGQVEMLSFMRPGIIPFEQWLEIDIPKSLGNPDEDIDPIVLGAKQDPIGRTWVIQAVCVEV